jgi:hypothetical protein
MMQSLLRERFNLKAHIEKREIDCRGYSDELARTGKLAADSKLIGRSAAN